MRVNSYDNVKSIAHIRLNRERERVVGKAERVKSFVIKIAHKNNNFNSNMNGKPATQHSSLSEIDNL